jgi:Domain of Unknown Function (DUF1080)
MRGHPLGRWAALLAAAVLLAPAAGADDKDDGFVPLFNGKDLTGWVNVNCRPDTFFVKDNEIVTTGHPTGYLRTARMYENFIAEFEWMHVNKTEVGNSGFFVWGDALPAVGTPFTRGIEVQVLVNLNKEGYYTSHGDLFSIQGATCQPDRPHPQGWMRCLPSEHRAKGGGEWNHYRVVANDGAIKLHVNGKEVSGVSACRPRKGYLALESEGAECHFRNLRIKELPSTNPRPEEVAEEAKDFVNLYPRLGLAGWKADADTKAHWQTHDWRLDYDGKGEAKAQYLWSAQEHGDCELIVDWRFPPKKGAEAAAERGGLVLRGGGKGEVRLTVAPPGAIQVELATGTLNVAGPGVKPRGQWNRLFLRVKGDRLTGNVNGQAAQIDTRLPGEPGKRSFALFGEGGPVEFANVFVRGLKE